MNNNDKARHEYISHNPGPTIPRRKKRTKSAKQWDDGGHNQHHHHHHNINNDNNNNNKYKPNIARIATDPDMQNTMVNIPNLMQAATRLTPVGLAHAALSPSPPPSIQPQPQQQQQQHQHQHQYPQYNNNNNNNIQQQQQQQQQQTNNNNKLSIKPKRKITATPPHLKSKPLPSMPRRPLPKKPAAKLAKRPPLPMSKSTMRLQTTFQTDNSAMLSYSVLNFNTLTNSDDTRTRRRSNSVGEIRNIPIPTYVPIDTTKQEMHQMTAISFGSNQNNQNNQNNQYNEYNELQSNGYNQYNQYNGYSQAMPIYNNNNNMNNKMNNKMNNNNNNNNNLYNGYNNRKNKKSPIKSSSFNKPKGIAFADVVHDINGNDAYDLTDDDDGYGDDEDDDNDSDIDYSDDDEEDIDMIPPSPPLDTSKSVGDILITQQERPKKTSFLAQLGAMIPPSPFKKKKNDENQLPNYQMDENQPPNKRDSNKRDSNKRDSKKQNKKKKKWFRKRKVRRLSDSEIVTPSSPYHPKNNLTTFAMYRPRKERHSTAETGQNTPSSQEKKKHNIANRISHAKTAAIPPINNVVPTKQKQMSFELGPIMIPGNNDDDESDDSDPPSITEQDMNEIPSMGITRNSANVQRQKGTKKKRSNKTRVRRNSDTIVFTPTTASVISDSSFMDTMVNAPIVPRKHHHYRSRINNDNNDDNINNVTAQMTHFDSVITANNNSDCNSNCNSLSDEMYEMEQEMNSMFANSGSMTNMTVNTANNNMTSHIKQNLSLVEEDGSNRIAQILPFNVDEVKYDQYGVRINNKNNKNKKRRRRNSDSELISTPTTPAAPDSNIFDEPLPSQMHHAPGSDLVKNAAFLPPKNVSMIHQTNKRLIDKLLGFAGHSWNFDNDLVEVFMEQCKNVKYETLVPSLKDILYPTMLSSLALPASAKYVTYSATVKYNLSEFVSVEEKIAKHSPIANNDNNERVFFLKFDFSFKTTIKIAIEELVHKIKKNHNKYSDYINKLHPNCFVLKVCGREEYLKVDDQNNKIISLSYIRNCLRKNEVLGMELILLYDDSINDLNDNNMRKTLRQSYNKYYYSHYIDNNNDNDNNNLEYEYKGYNSITNTLKDTINDNVDKLYTNLSRLNNDIEQEILWLRKKIGSVFGGDSTSVAYTPNAQPKYTDTYSTFRSEIDSFEWDTVNKDAVLLPEFEHPVQLQIESLKNIMLCPRFRMLNNDYYLYVLRIELMFGLQVFEKCSWDIFIPKSKISNNIEMPSEFCRFSTEDIGLHYASLPREAVWNFTLYGIKKDAAIEEELNKKRAKQVKKQKKKEPKILRAFITNKKQQENNMMNGSFVGSSSSLKPSSKSGGSALKLVDHISSQTIAEDLDQIIKKESFNDFYNSPNHTARSFNKTFFGGDKELNLDDDSYEVKQVDKHKKSQYISEPLAWCRLPMIDHYHCLMKGNKSLKMWTVPIFNKIKGGPKVDPYSTGSWKKFGTIRDCNLNQKNKLNSVVLSINFLIPYPFNVVAPIVNQRNPHYIRTKIKPYKKKDFGGAKVLNNIITRDGIFPLDERDKLLVYSNKEKLMRDSATIPTFLRSVSWLDQESRMEAYDYLEKWHPPKNPEDMIELLRYEFVDNRIRLYAINCLNQLDDFSLNRCLLQLVQAIKCESQHSSFLSRFLIIRALSNPFQIGHYLFWHLKSEYHDNNLQFAERFGLLIREYLLHLPYYPLYTNINLAQQLIDENNLINRLKFISLTIKNAKAKKKWSNKNLMNLLQNELMRLNTEIFKDPNISMTLPLNPSYKVGRIQFEKCKFMSSAKVPLWLVFTSADRYCQSSVQIMFKCGDDLRQDILTLQLISIMDAFWLSASIDLNMRVYEVIGTGYQVGMLELITNSKTTNDIGSSFNNKAHLKFITNKTIINKHLDLDTKKRNYAKSVAGFSVATWVLGIGDRHPDNIMIHQNGTLFHIDFGHFMGNFKEKNIGGLVQWKRERTPFVFTNAMKYCIEGKIKKKQAYTEFVKWLFNAYCEIRIRYKFFLNLLLLMVPSQMPELITESDVSYFREILRFDINDQESIASHVESTLKLCLSDKNKKFDDMMHKIHHL